MEPITYTKQCTANKVSPVRSLDSQSSF